MSVNDNSINTGSLTPLDKRDATAWEATKHGMVAGAATMIPTVGLMYYLSQTSKTFLQRTNAQSRTAIAIMPALFVFGLTAEHKLSHRMGEMAMENRHGQQTVQWAEEQLKQQKDITSFDREKHLSQMYLQSVASSGVNIVPKLTLYHTVANWTIDHPFKLFAAIATPTLAYVIYGRSTQTHLDFAGKLMHTRVMGQFAAICTILSVMMCKDYMGRNGKYITQEDADARVESMKQMRATFLKRLEAENRRDDEVHAIMKR
jgi:hypothetical protein